MRIISRARFFIERACVPAEHRRHKGLYRMHYFKIEVSVAFGAARAGGSTLGGGARARGYWMEGVRDRGAMRRGPFAKESCDPRRRAGVGDSRGRSARAGARTRLGIRSSRDERACAIAAQRRSQARDPLAGHPRSTGDDPSGCSTTPRTTPRILTARVRMASNPEARFWDAFFRCAVGSPSSS